VHSQEYITLEVARMQQADKFGRTHTAYVSVLEETKEEKPKKSSKKQKGHHLQNGSSVKWQRSFFLSFPFPSPLMSFDEEIIDLY
jgi:hypothetical protein